MVGDRVGHNIVLCVACCHPQVVGSLMYFQRALVVSAAAAVHGPAFRTSFFAALNTWSAAAILMMQVILLPLYATP
jgi:hypothetical protein